MVGGCDCIDTGEEISDLSVPLVAVFTLPWETWVGIQEAGQAPHPLDTNLLPFCDPAGGS